MSIKKSNLITDSVRSATNEIRGPIGSLPGFPLSLGGTRRLVALCYNTRIRMSSLMVTSVSRRASAVCAYVIGRLAFSPIAPSLAGRCRAIVLSFPQGNQSKLRERSPNLPRSIPAFRHRPRRRRLDCFTSMTASIGILARFRGYDCAREINGSPCVAPLASQKFPRLGTCFLG